MVLMQNANASHHAPGANSQLANGTVATCHATQLNKHTLHSTFTYLLNFNDPEEIPLSLQNNGHQIFL